MNSNDEECIGTRICKHCGRHTSLKDTKGTVFLKPEYYMCPRCRVDIIGTAELPSVERTTLKNKNIVYKNGGPHKFDPYTFNKTVKLIDLVGLNNYMELCGLFQNQMAIDEQEFDRFEDLEV